VANITCDVIVDRWRAIFEAPPFNFQEAADWVDFSRQPSSAVDRVYRIPPPASQATVPRFGHIEEVTDSVQVWIALKVGSDFDLVRRTALQLRHQITKAVIHDAFRVSGDYNVPGTGRGHTVVAIPNAEYIALRLTFAVNYDTSVSMES
jgi:hypothetical protein